MDERRCFVVNLAVGPAYRNLGLAVERIPVPPGSRQTDAVNLVSIRIASVFNFDVAWGPSLAAAVAPFIIFIDAEKVFFDRKCDGRGQAIRRLETFATTAVGQGRS